MDGDPRITRKVQGLKRRHIADRAVKTHGAFNEVCEDGATYVQNRPGSNMATFCL